MNSIWWNQVTNAVKFVTDIKESILEEKSILLRYTRGMPWRDQLKETIIETVKLQNAEKKFVDIPVVDNPGEYLLREFCKKEKRAEYRPTKGYAKFFAESEDIVLHDRYLWVQINDVICLDKWMTFVSDYVKERKKKANSAVFILECEHLNSVPVKKGIKVFSFDEYISEYDRIVFSVLASSSIKESSFIKNYLAELVANVAGNDIELCAECIKNYKIFLDDPRALVLKIVDTKMRSDEAKYSFDKDLNEVKHLVWKSQIKTIYPYLEEYREEFVEKNVEVIAKQLPIKTSYGEIYTDPKEVELGTLMYMVGCGCILLNTFDYEKLKRFKDARNKLSHLTSLTMKEINDLLLK